MKVVVCFNQVRVTVPCGDGAIPVKELISKAVHRYKRAVGKGSNHWVEVTSLKTISGGGILDPDDQLSDVADDKEQLIAEYDEQDRPSIQHNGGDGASASSTGTTSPDIFTNGNSTTLHLSEITTTASLMGFLQPCQNSTSSNNVLTDVVVTPRDLTIGSNLRVRRGSEPNLSLLQGSLFTDKTLAVSDESKSLIVRRESVRESDDPRSESSDEEKLVKVTVHGSLDRKKLSHSRFARDTSRTSLGNRPEMYHWLEAQEKAEIRTAQIKAKERMGPVEGHDGKDLASTILSDSHLICLQNDGGPLGIHAIPAYNEEGKDMGLLIQSIEQDRPVYKDGRIKSSDIIVEINGNSLQDVPFLRAQDIFRTAMGTKEIRLRIIKGNGDSASTSLQPMDKHKLVTHPPPTLPKPRSHAPIRPSPLTISSESKYQISGPTPAPRDASKKKIESVNTSDGTNENDQVLTSLSKKPETLPPSSKNVIKPGPPIKAPKKVPPAIPIRNPSTSLTAHLSDASLNAVTNTRKIGKKITIHLKKGPLGLGFSVTSRDNQTDGNCPIYIRNILPKGAAVQNGQLRPGDRLLEVNGIEMTGKTQSEAVNFLRTLPEGSVVELVLSRQEEVDEKFKVPRKMGDATLPESEGGCDANGTDDDNGGVDQHAVSPLQPSHCVNEVDSAVTGASTEVITLHIPLNETGSAGLGVSVKGKTESSSSGIKDLGIFVKTVLQGGAAHKDGRLQVNDKLLQVNGVKLEGMPNTAAMEALRVAMMEDSQIPGIITLAVSRRANSEHRSLFAGDASDSTRVDMVPSVIHKRASSASDVATVIHQRSSSASDALGSKFGSEKDMPSPIAPVRNNNRVAALRERFSDSGSGLRNESYTKATHESFNECTNYTNIMPAVYSLNNPKDSQFNNEKNIGIVENDTYTLPNKTQRPHSTIGFIHGHRSSHSSASDDEAFQRVSVSSNKDESDQNPDGELILPFAREGFGRQSMSEKRKGHLDPRQTETYKQVKANKENKGGSDVAAVKGSLKVTDQPEEMKLKVQQDAPSINNPMHGASDRAYQPRTVSASQPTSDMKRATSLENLLNIAATRAGASSASSQQNHEVSPAWRTNRFGRTRTCNESFRAAVDRSYDALDPALMDTLEEESAESGAFTLEPSHSSRSSISSEATNEDTNSMKRRKAKEKEKKGLFKGFLRFGKGRKSDEEAMRRSRSEERPEDRVYDYRGEYSLEQPVKDRWPAQHFGDAQKRGFIAIKDETQQQRGRRTSQQEQERMEEEYARLRDHHASAQRLRSQSVDPSVGRNTFIASPAEKTSPFQVYQVNSVQQQPPHHPAHHHQQQLLIDRSDPRSFHPAAMTHGTHLTGHDYIEKNQTYSSSVGADHDVKTNVAKAVMSRAEYMQQLRSQYQQRHRQRLGVYPLDDREEQYERQILEVEGQLWDSVSLEQEIPMRDPNVLQFYERPSSRQADQQPQAKNYVSFLNTNNSTAFHPASSSSHHHNHPHQHQWQDSADQSHRGSRPQSRGSPGGYDTSYQQSQGSSHPNQYHHRHHQLYPQQVHEGLNMTQFQDHYSKSDAINVPASYHTYEPRTQQFYTGSSHAYRTTPNQYSHHRGNAYIDSSSTKV